ncbi:hypothetical protein M3D63_12865, partial [Kocuria palustris]
MSTQRNIVIAKPSAGQGSHAAQAVRDGKLLSRVAEPAQFRLVTDDHSISVIRRTSVTNPLRGFVKSLPTKPGSARVRRTHTPTGHPTASTEKTNP